MSYTTHRTLLTATLGLSGLLFAGASLPASAQTVPTSPPTTPTVTAPPTTAPTTTTTPATTATTASTTTAPATTALAPGIPPAAPAPTVDPAAKSIVDKMVGAQQGLMSYAATIESSIQLGTNPPVVLHGQVSYQKPNKAFALSAAADGSKRTFLTDGAQRIATSTTTPMTYAKGAATAGVENIGATLQQSRVSASGILPLLVTDSQAVTRLFDGVKSATVEPDETLNSVPADVVKLVTPGGNGAALTVVFAIGKADHLLRRLDLNATSSPAQSVHLTETYTGVKANPPIAPAIFAFTPSPGMKLAVAPPPSAEPKEYDARIKVGAAPLPFNGTDLAGQGVKLAAYRGKVVLLDFWATWCGPCRAELPNVVAAYNKYHAKGLEIVGVSLDRAEDKAKLITYTKEHSMPWRQVFDGKYWQNAVAQAYGVQAIPFSVLIGKNGKIAAVNPRGEDLDPAVKAALAK